MSFKVGDRVRWTSQANGRARTKQGKIVAVVPPNQNPALFIPEPFSKYQGFGLGRNHESYIVLLDRGRTVLFWPRVPQLELLP